MDLSAYIEDVYQDLAVLKKYPHPWDITNALKNIIEHHISSLSEEEFDIKENVAIHKRAVIEDHVVLKSHIIIERGCLVKSGSYLREGVYLGKKVRIGANCEIKQSMLFDNSSIAHLNYVGNSIIGKEVNLEAGAVLANHFNERKNKEITVLIDGQKVFTQSTKFGSLLGDGCRIGANAVLNPGSILKKESIVGRLQHFDQLKGE